MTDTYAQDAAGNADSPDIVQFSSADIDQARSLLNRFYYPMAIGTPEGADGFELEAEVIRLGPLTVGELTSAGR